MLSGRTRVQYARVGAVVAVVLGSLLVPAGVSASFPGSNGLIAFGDLNPSARAVMTVAPDGGGLQTFAADRQSPSWSPTGKSLLFTDLKNKIRRISSSGANEKVIGAGFDPQFSPDGKRIVFAKKVSKSDNDTAIWIMRSNGKDQERLTKPTGFHSDEAPTFAPNGKRIAFHRELDASQEDSDVFTMTSEGKKLKNLTKTPDDTNEDPDYSPDGTTIVMGSNVGGGDTLTHLATMNPDGSGFQEIQARDHFGSQPAYSPDGTKIAYECDVPGPGTKLTLCSADPNGQGEFVFPNIPSAGPSGGFTLDPSWQPN